MFKYLFIIFTLLVASPVSATFNQSLAFGEQVQKIIVSGEFAISENQTPDQAYEAAIGLAKIKAAQEIGQYFEVVKLTDTENGGTKEYLASVSSANLKSRILNRKIEVVNEKLIAVVELEVEYSVEDMQRSLDRFMENEELRLQVVEAENRLQQLSVKLETQKRLAKEAVELKQVLEQQSVNSKTEKEELLLKIDELETSIVRIHSNIAEDIKSYHTSVAKMDVKERRVDTAGNMTAYSQMMEELEAAKKLQLLAIQNFITKLNNESYLAESINLKTGEIVFQPVYTWSVDPGYVPTLFGKNYKAGYKPFNRKRSNTLFSSRHVNPDPKGVAMGSYSLFYVIEINGKKYEMPIIAPLNSNLDSGKSHNDFCERSRRNSKGRNQRLCIAYKVGKFSLVKGEVLEGLDSKRTLLSPVSFPVSENVTIKQYYDIREVGVKNETNQ